MKIIVYSVQPLSEEQLQALKDKFQTQVADVEIDNQIDPSLISGLRFVTPTKVVDLSLKARLNQLKSQLSLS